MKNYIYDNDCMYTKKCENENCSNEILVGVSRHFCIKCLGGEKALETLICMPIPFFHQKWMM